MKKILKFVGISVTSVLGICVLYGVYFLFTYPAVSKAESLSIEATPERLARGKYLANHVTVCIDCHSQRNWDYFSGPIIPGTEGEGGFHFGRDYGLPGEIYAKNITPAGIGKMTDGELFRTITSGVRKNGEVLFPTMPYPEFNKLSDEDLYSIIAYIRTLKPIEHAVPETKLDFPYNFTVREIPARHVSVGEPDTSDLYAYGQYLANAADCIDCHTMQVNGERVKGMEFAGGREFPVAEGTVRSMNLTPDVGTGIGTWNEQTFVGLFKRYATADTVALQDYARVHNTIMPWVMFSGMTDHDLLAIYKFLRTLQPINHQVVLFTPAH